MYKGMAMRYWFFGLPGSGKTYLAKQFSLMTNFPQFEGDDFHTADDRKVIAEGAFTLAHRHAQLARVASSLQASAVADAIITHPLPDRASRALIREQSARLVYVAAPVPLIRERLISRTGHHFGVDLLDAWILRHWEDPMGEKCIVVNNDGSEPAESQLRKLLDV
jgi:gluconate kinase